ncbi:hypothetical protein LOK49_LG01G02345 [Camellia lanceoleosa]|uniref:Uncharacterized protein n=1 Tax=Camellia lanceoleosa TaxID=1840588 RepID=A0ACC0J5K1_9ERIC|nr:hypothetical protein LOK49_LG01G02345 [Camellia lanceoleosa]
MLWPPSPPPSKVEASLQEEEKKKPKLPENYQTCINIFVLFRDAFCVPFERGKDKPKQKDMERQAQENLTFPPNYQFWFEVVKLITKAMLIILGCGNTINFPQQSSIVLFICYLKHILVLKLSLKENISR